MNASMDVRKAIAAVETVVPVICLPLAVIADTLVPGRKDTLSHSTTTFPSTISAITGIRRSLYMSFALNQLSTNVDLPCCLTNPWITVG